MHKSSGKTRFDTNKVFATVFIILIFIMMALGIRTQNTYDESLKVQMEADKKVMENIDTIAAYINAKHSYEKSSGQK